MDEPTFYKVEDTAMRSELLDEIGDTLFAVAVAGAIGLSAANLAIQVNKKRATFNASAASHTIGGLDYPPHQGTPDARAREPAGQLNF
jgi:hypothetical protein